MANITELNHDSFIVVDDGFEEVPIKNKLGVQIGVFRFRPSDVGIIERFNALSESFNQITAPLEEVDINADGTVGENDEAGAAAFQEAERRLNTAIDELFGGNASEAFFGQMHPFSPVNGKFYCENVLDVVGTFISRRFDKETKKINSRVQKYTGNYRPGQQGKHSRGHRPGGKNR